MRSFLYRFGFETPQQARDNERLGWDHEDSFAIWIVAPSEGSALEWGRELSERYVAHLFDSPSVSWKAGNFAHGVEVEFTAEELRGIPVVRFGEVPDFRRWSRCACHPE